ncbi:LysR family transcriptional regulator [Pseudoalteromonas denitrificans]|uniref:Transcriptional regulator n=1 Tax=Pseudoalteromonas denitrificans DSM 6059 TaxID=1123010 RepID=A0A1I1MA33_9GAMM|nr:LysR family transcriptional regulator [Pseudoalteromonas denitrificans]SFC80058.1 transcriptional regulator [Pseudoalteromonas denitrificans DSM 6059]
MNKPDLNLVVIFDAIMQEQSISIAAERLAMTQPSVSNAVSRMRYAWRDPLFVKSGRGIKATPYAEQLWLHISSSLHTISQAVNPDKFIPETANRCFRIALTDGMATLLWLDIRKIIERQAPNIDIHAVPYTMNAQSLLQNAHVDLVADYVPNLGEPIQRQFLCNNYFVAVMSANHPLANETLSLAQFVQAEHVLVSLSGNASGAVDIKLNELKLKRRIAMTVNSFANATYLLKYSNLISVLPYSIVSNDIKSGTLIAKILPFNLAPAEISMAWHNRNNQDLGLAWLRDMINQIIDNKSELLKEDAWVMN